MRKKIKRQQVGVKIKIKQNTPTHLYTHTETLLYSWIFQRFSLKRKLNLTSSQNVYSETVVGILIKKNNHIWVCKICVYMF